MNDNNEIIKKKQLQKSWEANKTKQKKLPTFSNGLTRLLTTK